MSLFIEMFAALPRQGPGSEACTLRALEALKPHLTPAPAILDIGCGAGAQTLTLAKALPDAIITAVDLEASLLEKLSRDAHELGLAERIETMSGDMGEMGKLELDRTFDLIWSEGAIYIIGLEQGLQAWKPLLKAGGCLAISHIAWLTDSPSSLALNFWQMAYPQIAHRQANADIIQQQGFRIVDQFDLPASAWWQDYYTPMEQALEQLPDTPEAEALALECRTEIDLYKQHGEEYGYVFWLLKA